LDLLLQVETKGEGLAFAHQSGSRYDIFRRDVVQCPDLIVVPPTAPIRQFLGGVINFLSRELGHVTSSLPMRPFCLSNDQ